MAYLPNWFAMGTADNEAPMETLACMAMDLTDQRFVARADQALTTGF